MMDSLRSLYRQRGLTLIEVMTVLAVLGIVSVLVAPSFTSTFARQALRGAAGEAYADMQFARAAAIERNANVTVTFSSAGWSIARGGQTLKSAPLPSDISLGSGSAMTVVFEPVRGTATVNNGPVVFTHGALSSTVRLTVSVLGRPEVCTVGTTVGSFQSC